MAEQKSVTTDDVCALCVHHPMQTVLRFVLAAVFIYAAMPKLLHPDQFAESLLDYAILPLNWVNVVALWLPAFELVVGLCLLFGLWIRAGALAIAALSTMFLAALVWVQSGPAQLPCSCFSTDPGAETRTWWSLWQEAVLVLLSLSLWASLWPESGVQLIYLRKRQAVGLGVAVLIVVLLMAGIVVGRHQRFERAAAPPEQAVVSAEPLPKILDLGSATCHACQQMAPTVDELKTELRGKVDLVFVDVMKNPSYIEKYQVVATPTQIFLDASGKQVGRHEGVMTKAEVMAELHKLGLLSGP